MDLELNGLWQPEPAGFDFGGPAGNGRLPHALLLESAAEDKARAAALQIARGAVCEPAIPASPRPCGKCRHCLKSQNGNHPDILVYSAPAGAKSFPVDLIRKIRSEAYIRPNEAACKVYVLLSAQMMTEQAQNALLKVLEEPPASVLFVLTCDNKANLLDTVRSRCMLLPLSFQRETFPEKETPAESSLPEGFAEALCGTGRYGFFRLSARYEKDSAALGILLSALPPLFRDAMALRLGAGSILSGKQSDARVLAARLTRCQLAKLTETSLRAGKEAKRYVNTTLLLCWLFDRLWLDAHS